jgi:hypothetical protein
MHERTKYRLHSHDVPYGSGSGQQSVTGFPNVDDANSYWVCNSVCLIILPFLGCLFIYCVCVCVFSSSFTWLGSMNFIKQVFI